jgi:hypothetical protein
VQQQKILKRFSAHGYPLRNSADRSQRLVSWYFGGAEWLCKAFNNKPPGNLFLAAGLYSIHPEGIHPGGYYQ